MDKHTKAVLIVIAVCVAVQADQRFTIASETRIATKEALEAEFFDSSERTRYEGRLFSSTESYPLMEMR